MTDRSGVWAVLVAAGRGERLGGDRPKAFARLGERVLLAESLERLDRSEWIEAIVLVAPPDWEEPAILLAEEIGASKVTACVTGGETRTESVRAGVAEVPEDAAVILVHDAARPLLPDDVIGRVIEGLGEGFDGAVPALPVSDTVKRVDGDLGRLAHAQLAELRFLEVRVDIDVVERHEARQPLSGLDVVAGLHRAIADHPVERRPDDGERKVALGLGQRRLQMLERALGLLLLRL